MSKIRIKNFGPIKDGYNTDDGFMEIKKVTVFIGEQGTGKSSIAKLFSSFSWLEKAVNREGLSSDLRGIDIVNAIGWQQRNSYLSQNTEIEYTGIAYNIKFTPDNNTPRLHITKFNSNEYSVPKIMYVPAERNFLSIIKSAYDVVDLPGPLRTFAVELRHAQKKLGGLKIKIPFRDYSYQYDENDDQSIISGAGYSVDLLEASSGLQTLIPLYLVSRNLAQSVANSDENNISVNQMISRDKELIKITLDNTLSEEEKKFITHKIRARYHNKCFINIVEEPEQNLFPTSQRHILNSLLEFANMNEGNKLALTTHSPYFINYLSIAIQGGTLLEKIKAANREDLLPKLFEIVPEKSCISFDDVVIYQLQEDGSINRLANYEGIPSDKNYLNQSLAEGNHLFDSLLEIEEEL